MEHCQHGRLFARFRKRIAQPKCCPLFLLPRQKSTICSVSAAIPATPESISRMRSRSRSRLRKSRRCCKGNFMAATASGVNTAIMPRGMTETAFICTKAVRPDMPLILRSLHGRLRQKESDRCWKRAALLPMWSSPRLVGVSALNWRRACSI